jgi:hypothetical protein
MGGSIHIHGTASSIVDTVFVCRKTGSVPRRWLFDSADELAEIVAHDLAQLAEAGRKPTAGDTRCIIFGHLTRMAIWNLRKHWDERLLTEKKLERFAEAVRALADPEQLLARLAERSPADSAYGPLFAVDETTKRVHDAVAF